MSMKGKAQRKYSGEYKQKTIVYMRETGLFCGVRMKKYKSCKGEIGKVALNLPERGFFAVRPNEKWVTDVTEFSLFRQKLYLSPIRDLYNGEIVSFSLSEHPSFRQAVDMPEKAFAKIQDGANLILHSDQGRQYRMKQYQTMLMDKAVRQSMSRNGNYLDNAVMENFFEHLKSKLLYLQYVGCFKRERLDYLEYCNNRCIKRKLGGLGPVQYAA